MKFRIVTLLLIVFLFQACINANKKYQISYLGLETKTDASIRALHVVDKEVVWASGSGGTVLSTTNGGGTWKVIKVPGEGQNDFRGIYAWGKNKAMVFGVSGPRFGHLTLDGGQTWQTVYQDTTKGLFFNTLVFADKKRGMAISDQVDGKPFLIRTEDGGITWEREQNIPPVLEGEAHFAASNTCMHYLPSGHAWFATGGGSARVFYSIAHGGAWKCTETPMHYKPPSSGIFSISFKNEKEGVVVGGTYDQPTLNTNIAAYTSDGGLSWKPAEKMPTGYRSCVQFISDGNREYVLSVGKTGADISHDNGKTWTFLGKTGFYTIRAIPGTLSGYAAGSGGRIARFTIK